MEQREKGKIQFWLYTVCPICHGTFKVIEDSNEDRTVYLPWYNGDPGIPIDCPNCTLGDNDQSTVLRLRCGKDIFASHEIFECIDNDEYQALTDNQKERLNIILGLAFINIAENTKVRTYLSALFPVESTTGSNILQLLNDQAEPLN